MLLNGALTYWITFVEKGVVYEGMAPSGEKLSISTSTKKNVPIYHVKVTITPKGAGAKPHTLEFQRSFTEWFDSAGHFVAPPFQTVFASSVPLIATVDPKRVAPAKATSAPATVASDAAAGETDFVQLDQATLDALAAGATGADTTGSASGKKTKRRKA
jgi:signal peptidase complex subunit 2